MAASIFYRSLWKATAKPSTFLPSSSYTRKCNIATIVFVKQQLRDRNITINKNIYINQRKTNTINFVTSSPCLNSNTKKYNCKRLFHTTSSNNSNIIFDTTESILLSVHATTGLPWYATIVLSTIAFRLLFFPIVYFQAHAGENVRKAATDRRKANQIWKKLEGHRNFKNMSMYLQTLYAIKKKT